MKTFIIVTLCLNALDILAKLWRGYSGNERYPRWNSLLDVVFCVVFLVWGVSVLAP